MTDILGPASATNAVTVRPAESRTFSTQDSWFKPCTTPASQDGTQLQAVFFNGLLANLRNLVRGNGLRLDGITPVIPENSALDALALDSVLQLIQRCQANYGTDTGTSDALVVTPTTALIEYKAGLRFLVVKNPGVAANQSTTPTINFGLGNLNIVKTDASALGIGDLKKAGVFEVELDGFGNARLTDLVAQSDITSVITSNFIISTAVSAQIGGTPPAASTTAYPNYFPTLTAAFAWVSAYTITLLGSVQFTLPAGQTPIIATQLVLSHPNGSRILIVGAPMKGAALVPNSFAGTGSSASARANDRVSNLAAARNVYGSELQFTGGGGIVFGNTLGGFNNILVTGDGSTGAGLAGDLVTVQNGIVSMNGCSVAGGAGRGVLITLNGNLVANDSFSFGNGGNGWSVEEGGRLLGDGTSGIGAFGNTAHNINVSGGGQLFMDQSAGAASIVSRYGGISDLNVNGGYCYCGPTAKFYGGVNGVQGVNNSTILADGSDSSAHTYHGYYAQVGSTISALNTTSAALNGQYGYASTVGSTIYATGGNASGSSGAATPAVNTPGNQNSIVAQ